MKNPFIDDFEDGCENRECPAYSDLEGRLMASARAVARQEEAADRYLRDHPEEREEDEDE